jgi:hypothetical protein
MFINLEQIRLSVLAERWLSDEPVDEADLLDLIGEPPGWTAAGAALRSLEITEVGPARSLKYEPAERLNIITGNRTARHWLASDCIAARIGQRLRQHSG